MNYNDNKSFNELESFSFEKLKNNSRFETFQKDL